MSQSVGATPERPVIGSGEFSYEWHDEWAVVPARDRQIAGTDGFQRGARTHGIIFDRESRVVVLNAGDPAVLVFDQSGSCRASWGTDWSRGAHGLTLVEESSEQCLWITEYIAGIVARTTMDGVVVQTLARPPLPVYEAGGRWAPTWVAVDEKRFGGSGDVWVADGYGSSLVHRYSAAGEYRQTLDGSTGAGRFACPHGLVIDRRRPGPELYISDRTNRRVQVFDLEGRFKRAIGAGTSVCSFHVADGVMFLAEAPYRARVTLLDENDTEITSLAVNDEVCTAPGFPNDRGNLRPSKFNSPHAVTTDRHGNLFVAEWITGGRITKLARLRR